MLQIPIGTSRGVIALFLYINYVIVALISLIFPPSVLCESQRTAGVHKLSTNPTYVYIQEAVCTVIFSCIYVAILNPATREK